MRIVHTALLLLLFALYPIGALAEKAEVREGGATAYSKPGGQKLFDLNEFTEVKVTDQAGEWVKVSVQGWVQKFATDYGERGDEADTSSAAKAAPVKKRQWPVKIASYSVERLSKYDTGDVARVKLTLNIYNKTNKQVKSWDGVLFMELKKGGEIFRVPLSGSKKVIEPGMTQAYKFYFKRGEKLYDDLLSYPRDIIKLVLRDVSVQ